MSIAYLHQTNFMYSTINSRFHSQAGSTSSNTSVIQSSAQSLRSLLLPNKGTKRALIRQKIQDKKEKLSEYATRILSRSQQSP